MLHPIIGYHDRHCLNYIYNHHQYMYNNSSSSNIYIHYLYRRHHHPGGKPTRFRAGNISLLVIKSLDCSTRGTNLTLPCPVPSQSPSSSMLSTICRTIPCRLESSEPFQITSKFFRLIATGQRKGDIISNFPDRVRPTYDEVTNSRPEDGVPIQLTHKKANLL